MKNWIKAINEPTIKPLIGEPCEACGEFVEGFEYRGCCNGNDCGCMGQPIEPCICSTKCWNKFMHYEETEE